MAESTAGNTHRFSWGQFYAGIGLGIFVVYLLPGWIMLEMIEVSPDGRVRGAVGDRVFSAAWLLALGTLAYLLIKRRWEATTGLIVGGLGSGVFMLALIGSGI